MAEIFEIREQNIEHVELSMAAHRMRFFGIAALLEHTIAGVQHRSVWPGLRPYVYLEVMGRMLCCCNINYKWALRRSYVHKINVGPTLHYPPKVRCQVSLLGEGPES